MQCLDWAIPKIVMSVYCRFGDTEVPAFRDFIICYPPYFMILFHSSILWIPHRTPPCWGHLVFLQPLPKIHTSHQYLEDLHWFEAIFKNFACAIFEVVEVEWWSLLNFEAATSKFFYCSWKFGSWPQKGKVDLCMTNNFKVLIYLTLLYFLLRYLQEYSKIWNWTFRSILRFYFI